MTATFALLQSSKNCFDKISTLFKDMTPSFEFLQSPIKISADTLGPKWRDLGLREKALVWTRQRLLLPTLETNL